MKKFKKFLTMGLAAMMAVSAMSVSAFAAEESDPLVASISHDGEAVVEVHESDLDNGEYSIVYDGVTITIGDNENTVTEASFGSVASVTSVTTGQFTDSVKASPLRAVSGTNSYSYTFSVAKGKTLFTPYYHTVASGTSGLTYGITGDAAYNSKVTATVYLDANGGSTSAVDLTVGTHYVTFSGLTNGDKTYARVYNKSYSGSATGVCNITT